MSSSSGRRAGGVLQPPIALPPRTPRRRITKLPTIRGVPERRDQCPTTRPCQHIECRYHLQAVDDVDLPGRPRADGTVRRLVVESIDPHRPSCVLDVDRAMTTSEIARVLGVTQRQVRKLVRRAQRKLAGRVRERELELPPTLHTAASGHRPK